MTQDLSLFIAESELSLLKGDSSIYDIEKMSRNNIYATYGLGSLISLYSAPTEFSPGVTYAVKPTYNLASFARYGIRPDLIIVRDAPHWVVVLNVSRMPTSQDPVAPQAQSPAAAKSLYKSSGLHLGKFSSERQARAVISYVSKWYAANEQRLSFSENRKFGPYVTSLNVSYSIDGANQIQFTVIDKNYEMMDSNMFMNRRVVRYRGGWYEIGAVEVGPGPGGSPQITVTAWDEAVQRMKRDKKPDSISGSTVYDYALNVAQKYGLKFVAEKSNKSQTINKGNGNNADENVWSVLSSAANQDEFVFYVMDGTMVYASQRWLLWKFGTDSVTKVDPKTKKSTSKKYCRLFHEFQPGYTLPADAQKFKVIEWPTIRQSENDPLEGDGSIVIAKPNGCIIRPGHTVIIGPTPRLFRGGYLVTEVSFSEGTPDPVQISFRTPEKPVKQTETP